MKRRTFLIGSAAVVGGMVVGYYHLRATDENPLRALLGVGQVALTPYVIIDQNGVTIITPRAEMGQGIHTTLAAMVAEELDVALKDVKVEHGPASEVYSNTLLFGDRKPENPLEAFQKFTRPPPRFRTTQLTGAQSSSQDGFVKMRKAGAAARVTLIAAAAELLDVEPGSLTTDTGAVVADDGTRIPYTQLATAAAAIKPPQDPPLKPRSEWKILGRSMPRVDMVSKCTGTAEYAIDVRLPGQLYATVRNNPGLGGGMRSFDDTKAKDMPGVKKIILLKTGVIVVATNTWYAFEAAKKIDIQWEPAPYPDSTKEHQQLVNEALDNSNYIRPRDDVDIEKILSESDVIKGEYRVPYLAHATMEPLNALALLKGGRLDIWAGNQWPTAAMMAGAEVAGIDPDAVRVHTTYMGCGFGRRLETDFIKTAAQAARSMEGTPVMVTWAREEDMTHDVYRPMATARFFASLVNRRPVALDLHLSSLPLFGSSDLRNRGHYTDKPDRTLVMGVSAQPYEIDHYRVTAHAAPRLLPVGWLRSVGESQNGFFLETLMDELSYAAAEDPLTMRLALLNHGPSRRVLESVAEISNWGSELPEDHARGVAFLISSGAPVAAVLEIRRTDVGIEIPKAYVAVDAGIVMDPRNFEGQIEGSLIFGLTAAIAGEITVKEGKVEQDNFDQYPLLRMDQVPLIEVKIHESGKKILGVGEAATPAAAPALGNAIYALTGRRLRELPFNKFLRFA